MGFETPTEIQEKSIPILINDDIDYVGQAQTGTGKTAAFALPLLEKINLKSHDVQAMVIAPTRELANQICEEIQKLSQFEKVRTLAVYGGTSVSGQLRDLKRVKPQIVVGTPGRLMDFLDRGALRIEAVKFVVLDEADEMLDMGFFEDIKFILSQIEEKKIWMFSATMPKEILKLINDHFCDPVHVKVTKQILTSDSIDQKFVVVPRREQTEALCRMLDFEKDVYAIVFTRTKIGAKELTDELNMRGYPSDALHGDMSQDQRDLTMKKFKEKKLSLLVCTDVAARGIDVSDLTHVINFSLPQDNEAYVHRIGRTGRGGSKGVALSIIEPSEFRRVRDIERITKAKIEKVTLPEVSEIKKVLSEKAFNQFATCIETCEADDTYTSFAEKFSDVSKEDLLKGVYSFIFDQSLKRYKNAVNIDVKGREPRNGERADSRNTGGQRGYNRFFINLGRSQSVDNPGALIRIIARNSNIRGADLGRIDIKDTFSFFELPEKFYQDAMNLTGVVWMNQELSVEPAKAQASSSGGRPANRRGRGGRSSGGFNGNGARANQASFARGPRGGAGGRRNSSFGAERSYNF